MNLPHDKLEVHITAGDITTFDGDVVVNAANPAMLGGGGVDGAIHKAAGPWLYMACEQVQAEDGIRCPTGQVRPTPAFDLHAKWVFHTVGPIFELQREALTKSRALLRDCFRKSIIMAVALNADDNLRPIPLDLDRGTWLILHRKAQQAQGNPCSVCGKPGCRPMNHAGWHPDD